MSVSDIRTFSSIMGRKETKYVIWEPIYELCIICELYKENTKSNEFVGICCVQWLIKSFRLSLMDSIMKYQKWLVYLIKNSENFTTQVQVTSYWTLMWLPWPPTFIIHFKVYWICILGQPSRLSVMLNQVMLYWLWNWIVKPS